MKTQRLLILAGASIAALVILSLVVPAYWEHRQRPFLNGHKLIAALRAFARDQGAGGRRLPPEVSLQDLLRGGYLATNEVGAFEGMDLTFNTQADDSNPQMILAHARTPDGQFICLLADGSVQQLSRKRYEEQAANLGQPSGAAGGTQPVRLETNQTSAAAGPGRRPEH
jgi:hypothetical protein